MGGKYLTNEAFLRRCEGLTVRPLEEYKGTETKILWECLLCPEHKQFYCSPHSILSGNTKSCGCHRKSEVSKRRSKDLTGQKFGKLLVLEIAVDERCNGHLVWICSCDCGNICKVASDSLTTGNTKSCGCLFYDSMVGENNPNWNSNLSPEERMGRRLIPEYRHWSKTVQKLFNYTCDCCGDDKGGNLQSHHLNSYDCYPDERFDINNGVCLCEYCHVLFHKFFGFGNNTREQYEEFKYLQNNKIYIPKEFGFTVKV